MNTNPIDDWFASAFTPATTTTTPAPSAPSTPTPQDSGVSTPTESAPTPAVNGFDTTAADTFQLAMEALADYTSQHSIDQHAARPDYTAYHAAIAQIKIADTAYWSANPHPIVPDFTYDKMMFYIEGFEQKYHYRATDSPTKNPATTPSNGRKSVRRATPMLSTYKVHDTDAVIKWIKSSMKTLQTDTLSLSVEWKLDGVSVSLVYIDGVLTEASEGKGDYGNDVLQHCLAIPSIPNRLTCKVYKKVFNEDFDLLPEWKATGTTDECLYRADGKWPHRIEIRGEVVCSTSQLEHASAFGYDKNCRSTASGIMANRTSDPKACALLDFVPWQMTSDSKLLNNFQGQDSHINGQIEIPRILDSFGFSNAFLLRMPKLGGFVAASYGDGQIAIWGERIDKEYDTLDYYINSLTSLRSTFSFPTDGIIFKVNVLDYWQRFKNTDKKHKYLVAYKFPAQTAETTLRTIDHTVGSTGKVTPVGYFDPVVINGATYSKASIGSDRILTEMNIHPGDRIIVSLRNDVIPHIDGRAD